VFPSEQKDGGASPTLRLNFTKVEVIKQYFLMINDNTGCWILPPSLKKASARQGMLDEEIG